MPFVMPRKPSDRPASPEALFRELRPSDRTVRDLLLRQGDALRAYADLPQSTHDVAVELPTGAGKTLVGLLIAEWRRRALGQRVAYLCPTVQLARQAASKAEAYGLEAITLVRKQAEWDDHELLRFERSEVIVIAGYHQVFNSSPRLASAQTLILDDAHAAENAVASNWSIDVRSDAPLFEALAAIFKPYLPQGVVRQMERQDKDPHDAEGLAIVPPGALAREAAKIEDALDEHATSSDDRNSYVKVVLGSAVVRCLAYVSTSRILLRPMIPPTAAHAAFADADQRVYMSATLGAAGELERLFGVPVIKRVSAGDKSEQSFGRRFFIMPHAASGAPDDVTRAAITTAGRAVILTPSNRQADEAIAALVPDDARVLGALDIESDCSQFVDCAKAVLVLANRYDGIDLPDDACRLVILSGLPSYTNLQERFLIETLGADRVLSERIRTRIQQGAGRATRNTRDFAAVIVRTSDLTRFLARREVAHALPPQLQAEIEFGFTNSQENEVDLLKLLTDFWAQGDDWREAEENLRLEISSRERTISPVEEVLARSARKEVLAWRAVFDDDLMRAVSLAQEITDELSGGEDLRPYRALWLYLAASWAWILARRDPDGWRARAAVLQSEASGCAKGLRWVPLWMSEPSKHDEEPIISERARRAVHELQQVGIRGQGFEKLLGVLADKLTADRASDFEDGLQLLGKMLGFEAIRPNGQAHPDGVWRDGAEAWLVFEAKTEERADRPLSAEAVRQAKTHEEWVENVKGWERPSVAITVIVSHREVIDQAAVPLAGDLRICSPKVVRDIGERLCTVLREVRAGARGASTQELIATMTNSFSNHKLDTNALISELGARRIRDG